VVEVSDTSIDMLYTQVTRKETTLTSEVINCEDERVTYLVSLFLVAMGNYNTMSVKSTKYANIEIIHQT